MPVEAPLDGECENCVEDADDFGALKNLRDLALSGNQNRGLPGPADDGRRVDFDTLEMHTGITLHQVDRPLRLDSYAGSVRRHQELLHCPRSSPPPEALR